MQLAHLLLWLALAASLLRPSRGQMSQYRQHNNILDFQVPENAPPGYYLGQVRSADGRLPSLILPIKPTLESDLIAALQYNYTTGDLHTSASLDREQRERYQFLAIVTEQFIEVRCTVRVTDLNDNAPTFLMAQNETHVLIEVEEGQTGIRRPLPPAYDLDSPLYGIQQFQLMDVKHRKRFALVEHGAPARSTASLLDDSPFSSGNVSIQAAMAGENPHLMNQLDQLASVLIPSQASQQPPQAAASTMAAPAQSAIAPQSAPQTVALAAAAAAASNAPHPKYFYVDLEVNEPLDRENQSMYGLDVTVEDKGVIPMVSKLKIILKVIDINDNDPIFVEKLYECRVKEDELINTKLLRVEARDADEGANANIIYSIRNHTSTSSQSNSNPSDINEVSTPSSATGSNRFSGNKRTIQQQQQSVMAQQAPNGKLTLRSQQQDHGGVEQASSGRQFNSKQTAVGGGNSAAAGATVQEPLFHIDPIKGDIILVHSLDYETDQMHELIVEARDQGKPSRASTTTVRVFVLDVMDDPAQSSGHIQANGNGNDKFNSANQTPSIESAKLSPAQGGEAGDSGYFQNFNLLTWFAQINSSVLFIFVLVALIIVAFPVCFVKIKSRQPESDYNDTAGLTLTSNNGQTKQSPNHSSGGHGGDGTLNGDGGHGHHRRMNGSFAGLSGDGTFGGVGGKSRYQFSDSSNLYYNLYPAQQPRHHHLHHQQVVSPAPDSPGNHQMAAAPQGGTMTLQNHHHALLGAPGGVGAANNGGGGSGHHSLEHHQFTQAGHHNNHHHSGHHHNHHNHHHNQQQSPPPQHSSSLTYGHHHSRAAAALLHQAHHHQSSHHLSSVHQNAAAQNVVGAGLGGSGGGCGVGSHNNNNNNNSSSSNNNNNKGGTMNSIGTHHSGLHPSASPLPATPNTTNSSGLPPPNHLPNSGALLPPLVPSLGQPPQLPPTPCHVGASVFSWPQTPTSANCLPALVSQSNPGQLAAIGGSSIRGSTLDCTPTTPQHQLGGGSNTLPPAWIDLGTSQTQLAMAHDLYGSYNWDYLSDWAPEYNTLMQLIQADGSY